MLSSESLQKIKEEIIEKKSRMVDYLIVGGGMSEEDLKIVETEFKNDNTNVYKVNNFIVIKWKNGE